MIIHSLLTTFGIAALKVQRLYGNINPYSNYRPPFWAKLVATSSLVFPENEHQGRVKNCCLYFLENPTAEGQHQTINIISPIFLGEIRYYNIPTMS
jgi:hypothetical protein